uniref:RNase H type-1 domain-containing protein n=1 Tax=Oryza meridionalis TaxID=40149 RepID=A0A0E0EQS3_9ORYZ
MTTGGEHSPPLRSWSKKVFIQPTPLFGTNRNKSIIYKFIIDKFRAKLTTLKANKLSHAGLWMKVILELDIQAVNKSLILNSAWRLITNPHEQIAQILKEEAVHKIMQVPIMQNDEEDKLFWKHTRNGQCNTKSAYKEFYKRENQTLQQGNTEEEGTSKRRMDSIPNGNRCYTDAACENGVTGIGIFVHFPQDHNAIFIKAISDKAQSPLQAELLALQLALEISKFLNFADVIYLMDNATIMEAVKRNNLLQEPGHWSLKPFWLQITSFTPADIMQVR